MVYDIMSRLGNFLLYIRPYAVFGYVIAIFALGVAYFAAEDKVRANSKAIFISYIVAAVFIMAAEPIGIGLTGIFG